MTNRAQALTMKIAAYQRFSRKLTLRPKRSSRFEDITDAADGVEHFPALVDFVTETVDEDVHHVGLGVEAVVPDVFEDHGFGDHAAGVAHEVFEEGELARLQFDLFAGAGDFAGEQIQLEIADREAVGLGGVGGAADERLDAGEQFGEGEGFGEVIVAAGLEAFDAVVHGGLGAEDDHRHAEALLAQTLDEAEAVELGEHDVDDGGVVLGGGGEDVGFLAIGGAVDGEAALFEAVDHKRSDFGVILDD